MSGHRKWGDLKHKADADVEATPLERIADALERIEESLEVLFSPSAFLLREATDAELEEPFK